MNAEIFTAASCKQYLPRPKDSDHKYRRGVLGCVTGSKQYPGAALLSTSAAIAVGIGMVRYFGPDSVKKAVIQNRPEVVIQTGKVDAYLLGSGIPVKKSLFRKFTMEMAIRSNKPSVLDAGALYLAGASEAPTIITPHAGELAQMLSKTAAEIDADPIQFSKIAAEKFQVTVLLKGHRTVIANSERVIQMPAANSYLATAGTGDVLAGILGALIALNHEVVSKDNLIEIGATAVYIHSQLITAGPVTPTEMIARIPGVIKELSA